MRDWLIAVFDRTGNVSRPYREAGWDVSQIDIQNGQDFMQFNYIREFNNRSEYGTVPRVGIIAPIPCDNYAVCGAKHFAKKDSDGTTARSQLLVDRLKEMVFFFDDMRVLMFWQVENPKTRIHNLNPWLKPITQRFNPCDFAGYDPNPDDSRYNKDTWLFGRFNKMKPNYMEPHGKEYPGFTKLGGKSLATKNARSISPLGYCYAFYEQNH